MSWTYEKNLFMLRRKLKTESLEPFLKREYLHVHPIHTAVKGSPLSNEQGTAPNYTGFYTLTLLLLAVMNLRLAIENYLKYGLLVSFDLYSILTIKDLVWSSIGLFGIWCHILVAFWIETIAVDLMTVQAPTHTDVKSLHKINCTILIIFSMLNSWFNISHPLISGSPLFISVVVLLKLISYALVNADLRDAALTGRLIELNEEYMEDPKFKSDSVLFPDNITFGNLVYFIFAPTLSYQPVYPRNTTIRISFILKRSIELVISVFTTVFLAAQYAFPILKNSLKVLDEGNSLKIAERLLKLSVISLFMWLLMFFAFFHCALNIIAELMKFGDRSFYLPWWNAKDIAEYWRLWNLPVYKWGKRHVYLSLSINHKTSRFFSILVVFTISALLHEILVGIPTHNLNGIAFMGMMGQIPLIVFTNWLTFIRKTVFPGHKHFFDTVGNLIFWISFTIVGQPACILIYYCQWYADQRGVIR